MIRNNVFLFSVVILATMLGFPYYQGAYAQSNLVASLEVLEAGVDVQTADTAVWIPIRSETLINVGDSIRTNETGEARLTFFSDGTSAILTPNSQIRIDKFTGSSEKDFNLSLEILGGIVKQQVNTILETNSSYEVITPGMSMVVRGTDFDVRVEGTGRSALITFEGDVSASKEASDASVPAGFGVRADVDAALSDVVAATSFESLDSALDGCTGSIQTEGDIRMYVRIGPSREFSNVGSIDPGEVDLLLGQTTDGEWYRIPFRGGFGWVSSTLMNFIINDTCPGIRQYDNVPVEDISLYTSLDLSGDDAIVLVEGTSLRERPGTSFSLIDTLGLGEIVTIVGRAPDGEWLQVRTSDGDVGWVAINLVRIYSDVEAIEIIEEPEATPEATEESSN